jgi:hypothetical protein
MSEKFKWNKDEDTLINISLLSEFHIEKDNVAATWTIKALSFDKSHVTIIRDGFQTKEKAQQYLTALLSGYVIVDNELNHKVTPCIVNKAGAKIVNPFTFGNA